MIEILNKYPELHTQLDYELKNGDALWASDWNGICYHNKKTGETWTPVYRYQSEGINLDGLEENSAAWNKAVEIIGFNKS